MGRPLFSLFVGNVLAALLYLGAALAGLQFEPVSGFATLVWPPNREMTESA
ncbi:MAG: hypothetical protein G01um101466_781 [Parcubacteria group bacterium Gr01-1014_66]|nr:MAG: hypothetical protein G01um101466_781 [Parcubacteria group bacterium Gr01-1014_66]